MCFGLLVINTLMFFGEGAADPSAFHVAGCIGWFWDC
jgi:hypothetical protein